MIRPDGLAATRSPLSRPLSRAGLLLAVICCLLAPAMARADVEPNNNLVEAEGPLGTGTMSGAISPGDEGDWYWVQLGGQQQVTLTVELAEPNTCARFLTFDLRNADGEKITELSPDAASNFEPTTKASYSFSTPAASTTYYLNIFYYVGRLETTCAYRVSFSPASAIAPAPTKPPVVTVPEPNESPSQAYGPLKAGVTYQGEIETLNDKDLLYLNVRAGRTVKARAIAYGCEHEVFAHWIKQTDLEWIEGGNYFTEDEADIDPNSWTESISFEGEDVGEKWYLELSGIYQTAVGCKWRLEVGPASALYFSHVKPQQAKQPTCKSEKRNLARLRARLHRAERTLRFVHNPRVAHRLRHKIHARQHAIKRTRKKVKQLCT